MRWLIGLFTALALILVGWLWLSPPSITVSVTASTYTYQPLGPLAQATVDVVNYDNSARVRIVTESLHEVGYTDDQITPELVSTGTDLLADGCRTAREDRQSAITLTAVAAATIVLALLIWVRTRKESPSVATADED